MFTKMFSRLHRLISDYPRSRFERLRGAYYFLSILLVLFVPIFYDWLAANHENGVCFWLFLGLYVCEYTCYVWLANCYVLAIPGLFGLMEVCEFARVASWFMCLIVYQILFALYVGASLINPDFYPGWLSRWLNVDGMSGNVIVATAAYGSLVGILFMMFGCRLLLNATRSRESGKMESNERLAG